jgi:hypothetical protein
MSASVPVRTQRLSIIPERDGDPSFQRPYVPSETGPLSEILECAETLGIPWKRILLAEIEAEQRLRRYLPDMEADFSLLSATPILSFSLLRSWRVRDQVESLACEAREASGGSAVRKLRIVFQRLSGKNDPERFALAQHLRFAYQRVLLLQRVLRVAARSHGGMEDRLAFICSSARCTYDDAAWAISEERAPRRGHRLDTAVRKVRSEGFAIPRAENEARSLADLRRVVRALSSPMPRHSQGNRGRGSRPFPLRTDPYR